MKKYENFCKALNNLNESKKVSEPYSVVEQTGIAALFEICFEQSWKLMKEVLEYHGRFEQKTGSPRMIIKTAYECGMIDNEGIWLDILDTRNMLAHTYDENEARKAVTKIKNEYIPAFEELKRGIDDNWLN